MKYFSLLFCSLMIVTSCKKTIEKAAEDAVVKIMVTGQWKITKYTQGSADITGEFAAYSFQFKENKTVDAIKSGAIEKTGTWEGNATDLNAPTIYANFTNATYPLSLLNGTFLVTKTGQTFVEAKKTVAAEEHFIRLDKM